MLTKNARTTRAESTMTGNAADEGIGTPSRLIRQFAHRLEDRSRRSGARRTGGPGTELLLRGGYMVGCLA